MSTAGKLKKLLENVSDDTPVLIPGNNHDYYDAYGEITTALKLKHEWTEDFGELDTPEAVYGKRTPVLVLKA